jgi:hypothetical protein
MGYKTIIFSPDGKRIAYPAERSGQWFVVVDKTEGTSCRSLLNHTLCFSPDSRCVAYVAERNDRYFVVVDGKEQQSYDEVGRIVFSPDSRHMLYSAKSGDKAWIIMDGLPVEECTGIVRGSNLVFDGPKSFHALIVRNEEIFRVHLSMRRPSGATNAYTDGRLSFAVNPSDSQWQHTADPTVVHKLACTAYTAVGLDGFFFVTVPLARYTLAEMMAAIHISLRDQGASCSMLRQVSSNCGHALAEDITCRTITGGIEHIQCIRIVVHPARTYQLLAVFKDCDQSRAEQLAAAAFDTFRLLDDPSVKTQVNYLRRWTSTDGLCWLDAPYPDWRPNADSLPPDCVFDLIFKGGFARLRIHGEPYQGNLASFRPLALQAFAGRCDPGSFQVHWEKPWPKYESHSCIMEISAKCNAVTFSYLYSLFCTGRTAYQVYGFSDPLAFASMKNACFALTSSFFKSVVARQMLPPPEELTCTVCRTQVQASRIPWQRFMDEYGTQRDRIAMHICSHCSARICHDCAKKLGQPFFHWWSGWSKCKCPVCHAAWEPREVAMCKV